MTPLDGFFHRYWRWSSREIAFRMDAPPGPPGRIRRVDLGEQLGGLTTLEQTVVAMVYFEGRTPAATAQALTVDQTVAAAALARAYRRIADWLLDGEDDGIGPDTSSASNSSVGLSYVRPAPPVGLRPGPLTPNGMTGVA